MRRHSDGMSWANLVFIAFVGGAFLATIFLTAWGQAKLEAYGLRSNAAATWLAVVAAIGLGAWNWRTSMKIAKVSTKPYINFTGLLDHRNNSFRLAMKNAGLGPCSIEKAVVLVDGEPPRARPQAFWIDVIAMLDLGGVGGGYLLHEGLWVPPQAEVEVMLIEFDDVPPANAVYAAIARLSIAVTYSSIYGERFEASFTPEEWIRPT